MIQILTDTRTTVSLVHHIWHHYVWRNFPWHCTWLLSHSHRLSQGKRSDLILFVSVDYSTLLWLWLLYQVTMYELSSILEPLEGHDDDSCASLRGNSIVTVTYEEYREVCDWQCGHWHRCSLRSGVIQGTQGYCSARTSLSTYISRAVGVPSIYESFWGSYC